MPLVLRSFAASKPLKTGVSVVFKIELLVVESEEMPNVVVPLALLTVNCP